VSDVLLQVDSLSAAYRVGGSELPVLRDISFSVNRGEIVGIVGESGCGKSTLSLALLRLLPANGQLTSGEVFFGGRDLRSLSEEEMRQVRGRDIAMIFQDPVTSLNPTFTIGSQMTDAQRAHSGERERKRSELREKATLALTQVGIPDASERLRQYPHQFSGGQRQRIMIATTLLLEPGLLVADEPTSSLDVTLEAQILELLRQLRQDHRTAILLVTHDLGVVAETCDKVIVMYAGRIVEEAEVSTLFREPKHPYTRALLAAMPVRGQQGGRLEIIPGQVPSPGSTPKGCSFAERCRFSEAICREVEPELLATGDGKVRCHIYGHTGVSAWDTNGARVSVRDRRVIRSEGPIGSQAMNDKPARPPIVTLRDLKVHFSDATRLARLGRGHQMAVRAVDGVSFEIRRGEVLGLVGESGSGKTSLGEAILRLLPATGGAVLFDGQDVLALRRRDLRRFRRRAQMIFQDPYTSLSPRRRVGDLLTEPYKIMRIPPSDRYTLSELLGMVGLSPALANHYPNQLSGGQARRVGIARALALRPEFIVADEPTSGLDVSVSATVLNLMKDLGDQLGLTYLIITHNLNLVAYMADRIAVLYLGKLVELGSRRQILGSPAHPYTRALLRLAPEPEPGRRRAGHRLLVAGEIPSPINPPSGCRFHTRCSYAQSLCTEMAPPLEEVAPGHYAACHFWKRIHAEEAADPSMGFHDDANQAHVPAQAPAQAIRRRGSSRRAG
jgi:peptide/nickel transport system ATP-binding protein